MPRTGMETERRASLVDATIAEIGRMGSLDVTVSQIARRAGVSSALAHHYFGTKERIFLSAMRHILTIYGQEVRQELHRATTPRGRLDAVVRGSFAHSNFRPEVIASWLIFYVSAHQSPEAAQLLDIYKRRLRSNLVHGLRPLIGDRAGPAAEGIAAMIDGLYIRQGLGSEGPDPAKSMALVTDYIDRLLKEDT